jgi:hypothetical protein
MISLRNVSVSPSTPAAVCFLPPCALLLSCNTVPAAELAPGGELLLCSGTVANPQLLMLSGIGPKQQLSEAGVKVVAEAEGVGKNLQDHPATLWASL